MRLPCCYRSVRRHERVRLPLSGCAYPRKSWSAVLKVKNTPFRLQVDCQICLWPPDLAPHPSAPQHQINPQLDLSTFQSSTSLTATVSSHPTITTQPKLTNESNIARRAPLSSHPPATLTFGLRHLSQRCCWQHCEPCCAVRRPVGCLRHLCQVSAPSMPSICAATTEKSGRIDCSVDLL